MKSRIIATLAAALIILALVAAPAAQASTAYRWQLITAINKTRLAYGLPRVYLARGLGDVAQRHSSDMLSRHYFAHTSPTGSTLYYRVMHSRFQRVGAWWAGETLAWGAGTYATPAQTIRMWLNSPTHRAILLSPRYTCIGVGRAVGTFEGYRNAVVWTADWGHH